MDIDRARGRGRWHPSESIPCTIRIAAPDTAASAETPTAAPARRRHTRNTRRLPTAEHVASPSRSCTPRILKDNGSWWSRAVRAEHHQSCESGKEEVSHLLQIDPMTTACRPETLRSLIASAPHTTTLRVGVGFVVLIIDISRIPRYNLSHDSLTSSCARC